MPVNNQLNDLPAATQKAPVKPKTTKAQSGMGQRKGVVGENGNITSQVNERALSGTTHKLVSGSVLVNH